MLGDNDGSRFNDNNTMLRFVSPRWISFFAVALLFLSGRSAKADPVGDFFKKVGQSISKAFQPKPSQHQTKKHAAEAGPTPLEQPSKSAQEEKVARTVLPASAAPVEKTTGDMPYGIPVPGQKGMVTSPYSPEGNYVDVGAFAPGTAVKDPYTGKIFRVP